MKEVVSVDVMRDSDRICIESGTPAVLLMERAAEGICNAAEWKMPVAIVCGPGNNGGDGFAAAVRLTGKSIKCKLFVLSDRMSEAGKYWFDQCQKLNIETSYGIDQLNLDGFGSVLDCIFGTGLSKSPEGDFKKAIEIINSSGAYVVSADINSGINGDSGLPPEDGGVAVRSHLTVSVGTFKSGHFLNSAKDYMSRVENCDISIPIVGDRAYLIEKEDIARLFSPRRRNCNKGDFGSVAIIGGSLEYSGAAKLANMSLSALRAGAGIARLAVPDSIAPAVMPYILESTLFPLDSDGGRYRFSRQTADRLFDRMKAAAVGMGIGRSSEVAKLIEYALENYHGRLILDADGLNTLAEIGVDRLKNASCRVILTPHPGEFSRLTGVGFDKSRHDLITAAKDYAGENKVILLLKGASTIITDGKTVYITDRGCAGMATGGSGDLLSGIIAGICGYVSDDDLLLGVAAGAYLNGLAGERAQRKIPAASMIASDTAGCIPEAMREIIS